MVEARQDDNYLLICAALGTSSSIVDHLLFCLLHPLLSILSSPFRIIVHEQRPKMANAAPVKAFPILAFLKVHSFWVQAVNSTVPEPYLDEVFHVPQAQAYWAGNWTQWDPKITTPPGLYLFSNAFNNLSKTILKRELVQTTEDLRNTSAILLWLLFVSLRVFRSLRARDGRSGIIYRELNIMLFPMFFFFSALYYTDLLSALTVMVSYIFWGLGQTTMTSGMLFYRFMHFLSGLAAVATRQTNIFWVAIFLGGLQVVQTINLATRSPSSPRVAIAQVEGQCLTISLLLGLTLSRLYPNSSQYRKGCSDLYLKSRAGPHTSTVTSPMLRCFRVSERGRCSR